MILKTTMKLFWLTAIVVLSASLVTESKGNPTTKAVQSDGACSRNICALYDATAKSKAASECGLKKGYFPGNCICSKSTQVCEKNWRGKEKHTYNCICSLRSLCSQVVCALYDATAKTKAAKNCGVSKGYNPANCACKATSACGKNWRGKEKHNYVCECR